MGLIKREEKEKEGERLKYFAGVDLGGTNIAAGITDEAGRIAGRYTLPTNAQRGFDMVVCDMADAVKKAAEVSHIDFKEVRAIGVGVPGAVSKDGVTVLTAPNLGWEKALLGFRLEEITGKSVYLGNDADCAVLAESVRGAASGKKSAVMLTLGTGVGGGIIIDGRLFTGGTNDGTELGHMILVHNGEQCSCGNRGCIETYASATALIRQTKNMMERHADSLMWKYSRESGVNGKTAFDAAKAGDKWAKCVIDKYISYVASSVVGLVNVFRPEIVVIGGGIAGQGEYFIDPLSDAVKKMCYAKEFIEPPEVVAAGLGGDAGVIGAAMLCMQKKEES